jgi:hypothetical protein
MKKLVAISLLALLTLPFAGTYLWLGHQTRQVKRTIKWQIANGLPDDQLVRISVTPDMAHLLRWEHSKEFEFRGEMYDVVRTEVSGDTTHYHCWWDHEETALNQQVRALTRRAMGQDPQNRQKQERLEQFARSLFVSGQDFDFTISLARPYVRFGWLDIHYLGLELEPPTPPPALV